MKQGLTHVYTGNGKGKTTAALGLLLRAYGRGMLVALVQFLKGRVSGEVCALENLPGITVFRYARDYGFYKTASEQDRQEMARLNNIYLTESFRLAKDGLCGLLILDEIFAAYNNKAIDTQLADKLILNKPPDLELVLTGRNAPQHFTRAADYVTEFVKRKHPYDIGITSREGIEF